MSLEGHRLLPVFVWVKESRDHGICDVNFQQGKRWISNLAGVRHVMCYSEVRDAPLDLFVEERNHKDVSRNRLVTFEYFKPGKPDPSHFDIPDVCK